MEQKFSTKDQIIAALAHSSHASSHRMHEERKKAGKGKIVLTPEQRLEKFVPVVDAAAQQDPEFLARLTAWNRVNGHVRDSQIAFPVASLRIFNKEGYPAFHDNALAHLASHSPRDFLRGLKFGIHQKVPGQRGQFRQLVTDYLQYREARWPLWTSAVVTNRRQMQVLYAMFRVKPAQMAKEILFEGKYPRGSVFWDIKHLSTMSDLEAAATIMKHNLPMLVVTGAWQGKKMSEDVLFAMLKNMTPTEVVTNMKNLKKYGVTQSPALRGLLQKALDEVAGSKKQILKTTRAAKIVANVDADLAKKLMAAQQKQLDNFRIKANVAVLTDASSSMQRAIEVGKMISAFLASVVEGKVYLIFMNTTPRPIEVTGKSYDEIQKLCEYVRAGGATSLGCGLEWLLERNIEIGLVAMVSDGAENTPPKFAQVLKRYQLKFSVELPVCHYWMECTEPSLYNNNPESLARSMEQVDLPMQVIDLRHVNVDYNSLPNLVATMQTKKYGLLDAIMETPLLTRAQVFA